MNSTEVDESEAEAAGMRYVPWDTLSPRQRSEAMSAAMQQMTAAVIACADAIRTGITPALGKLHNFAVRYEAEHGRCEQCDMLFCEHR